MTNYFEFFGLPVSPNVDQDLLKRAFYANSKRFHPDFHTLSDEATQDDALEQSTTNNQGYKILSNEDLRLKHFLDIHGALGEEGSNKVPQSFLIEMMDVNEALMELEFEDDPAAREKVDKLISKLEEEIDNSVTDIMGSYTPEASTEGQLSALKDYYLKRRYLLRLRNKI